jgi:succinate-semialdehyde dehydrogenase/glutarate-semialdehyde dehydrogenase
MYPDIELFVDGRSRRASGRRAIDVVNPATGERIGSVAHAAPADLDEAIAATERGSRSGRPSPLSNTKFETHATQA